MLFISVSNALFDGVLQSAIRYDVTTHFFGMFHAFV